MAEVLIDKRRIVTAKGSIIEMVAWLVPYSDTYTEGIKYSFVYIRNRLRVFGIDNFNNEGHHTHINNKKEPYMFYSLGETRSYFIKNVKQLEEEIKDND